MQNTSLITKDSDQFQCNRLQTCCGHHNLENKGFKGTDQVKKSPQINKDSLISEKWNQCRYSNCIHNKWQMINAEGFLIFKNEEELNDSQKKFFDALQKIRETPTRI